jgi:hypothetical protein
VFVGWRAWGERGIRTQGAVLGRVVDLEGRAISGARVTLEGYEDSAITAPDGSFRLPVAVTGDAWLDVEVAGWSGVRIPVRLAGARPIDVGAVEINAPPR